MKKKLLSIVLAASMVTSVCACGNNATNANTSEPQVSTEKTTETASSESTTQPVEDTGITFPLAEEMSFEIVIPGTAEQVELLEKCQLWKDLYEMTNVKVEITPLDTEQLPSLLAAMYAAGKEPDAIWTGSGMSSDNITALASEGYLMQLNDYVGDAEIMPNFSGRVLAESPSTKGLMADPNGNIYSLPRYNALMGDYLESAIWINKTWLDKLDLEIPTTMEALEAVLEAFAKNDLTGNGNTDDEIPYFVKNSHGSYHYEVLLGSYGIATKNGAYENFVAVKDGEVSFVPVSETYKEYIKMLNRWYDKGIIWEESFTASGETVTAKYKSETPVIGMVTAKNPPASNYDDYVRINPVTVEGFDPCWYLHPGFMGVTGMFSVSASCENADVLLKWMDLFYDFDISTRVRYGEPEDGRYEVVDGKVKLIDLDQATTDALKETAPTLENCLSTGITVYAWTAADFNERVILNVDQQVKSESYEAYYDYLNTEIWPRPAFAAEDSGRIGELRTDIFNTVEECKAAWITGERDIEAEWDSYVETINKMGLDEFVSIYQERYDVYMDAQK